MSYLFDHGWQQERERLALLEAALDPWTVYNLEQIGIQSGWRCLEVGAGGGSIAKWLAERVGPNGSVVATDIETMFLEAIEADNLEIRKHDIVTDPIEKGKYDLIHSRAVLDHLPERDAVTKRLIASLKPGGWLTIEGGDFSTVVAVACEDSEAFEEGFRSMVEVGRSVGMDPTYGRNLGQIFRAEGLVDVSLSGMMTEWGVDHPLGSLYLLTFERLRKTALEKGMITKEKLLRLFQLMQSPSFRAIGNTVFFCSGISPGEFDLTSLD